MALEGTIKDFGLADIFQLIALQKKTGVLELESKGNTVNISFKDGRIVSADTPNRREGDRLGEVLVKAGKIEREQLKRALEISKGTDQRLGHILAEENIITKEDLSVALQHQIKSLIFQLFHWKEGNYRFIPKMVTLKDDLAVPVETEYILMEGMRILDELSFIEQRIPSFDTVLNHVQYKHEELEGEISLSEEDKKVLELVDGKSDLRMILDSCGMDEVYACNILIRLMDLGLIEKSSLKEEASSAEKEKPLPIILDRINLEGLKGMIIGSIIVIFILIEGIGLLNKIKQPLSGILTSNRIEDLKNSIRRYYLDKGEYPSSIKSLLTEGYKKGSDIVDPWGRLYIYKKIDETYEIYSSGPDRIEGNKDDIR